MDALFPGMPLPATPVERGFAIGVFDLFHVGHLRYLQHARRLCQHLTVSVTPDEMVARYKQRLPAIPYAERAEILQALRCVDAVICHRHSLEATAAAADWIAGLNVSHAFIGSDWQGSARWNRLGPALAERGVVVCFLPRSEHISSSQLRSRLDRPDG